jgi:hypothetical protein
MFKNIRNMNKQIYYEIKRKFNVFSFASRNLQIDIYRTVYFPVILYGCEAWSLTLRKEHKPVVFENRVLRRIF